MSTTLTIAHQAAVTVHQVAVTAHQAGLQAVAHADGDSIFDMGTKMSNSAKVTMIAFGGAASVAVVIFLFIKKQTVAGLASAALVAGGFYYVINNVTSSNVQNPIKNTVNDNNGGAPAPGITFPDSSH